jgi:hypothetical protein
MNETPEVLEASENATRQRALVCDQIADALCGGGPTAALDHLIDHLGETGEYRELLDALLLKARLQLNLPLIYSGSLSDLPEPARTRYEEKYIEAIRLVGSKYLDAGDIPAAWAYYRALGETSPVSQAILDYRPSENDERLGAIIEVAFNNGVNPRRGFDLILEHYGTCPAISAFEQLPPQDGTVRSACAERLVGRLHNDLVANLRSDIANRGQLLPPEGATIGELIRGREWLFSDDAYHIDISHLAAVVRFSVLVNDPEVIALAVDLTEYGRRLSPRLLFEGAPPFEQVFADHGVYLGAMIGRDVEHAIVCFQSKIAAEGKGDGEPSPAAQALVNLLVRLGRTGQALNVACAHLAGFPDSALCCPTVARLCERAGELDRLVTLARDHGDLVHFAAALIQTNLRS